AHAFTGRGCPGAVPLSLRDALPIWPVAAVPAALDALLADQVARVTRMGQHIDAGVVGTSLAVAAYEAGQEEMATTFARDTITAAESGDLAPFLPYLQP